MWNVNIDCIYNNIKHYKSDKIIIKKLEMFIDDLESLSDDEDPSVLGSRKAGKFVNHYGYHLNKSVSVLYMIDFGSHTIHMEKMGDHKEVYGKD